MIHSQSHLLHPNHPSHRAKRLKQLRRSWGILGVIVLATLLFTLVGYFAGVSWLTLFEALAVSTYRVALSYGIALVLGTAIALLLGSGRASDFFFPFFDVLQNIPSFALIPLFIY